MGRWLRWFPILALTAAALAQFGRNNEPGSDFPAKAEFHFVRVEYAQRPGVRRFFARQWWMIDMPEAETHFTQGIRRLTRIDAGEPHHFPISDDRVFDHPWIYATQAAYWNIDQREGARLRDYLLRGGFLVVDDFHGEDDWAAFRDSMSRVFPGQQILEIEQSDPLLHVLYDINERTYIPGLRHLRRGPGGSIVVQPQAIPPHWRALYDPRGRLAIAVNFNMDIGDAWEHADLPEYPEEMTALAYRFGLNYIIYSMTH
jgi:hypothetical protein